MPEGSKGASPVELRKALREELKEYPYGASGLDYNILFNKVGYTIHYAENVVDPTDGEEKLVMADAHTKRSAIIYNLKTREIEWEFTVPGTSRPNPHTARMLVEDVAGFGSAGDIYCCDRDNHIIVVDRQTQNVKFSGSVPWILPFSFVHEAVLGVDKQSLIVSDYGEYTGSRIAKLRIPDLSVVWQRADIPYPSKVSIIEGAAEDVSPSFGGEYLVVSNHGAFGPPSYAEPGTIYELKDSDGTTAWVTPNPPPTGAGAWLTRPHSAFRRGRVENHGAITVVGSESGGGILGIGYTGEPLFGFNGPFVFHSTPYVQRYYFNPYLLAEVTHVFPTLNGRIGFTAWSKLNSSVVAEIVKFPQKQNVSWTLAFKEATTDAWVYLEPIVADSWDEVQIGIKNTDANSLDRIVYGYMVPYVNIRDYETRGRFTVLPSTSIASGGEEEMDFIHPYCFYRVGIKATTPGSQTTYQVFVTKKRG